MLAFLPDIPCRDIRFNVALGAGVGLARHLDGETVPRVAGRTGTAGSVRINPANALVGEVPLSVSLNNQDYTPVTMPFLYYATPSVSSSYPVGGRVNTIVYLLGTNFAGGVTYKCKFGTVKVDSVYNAGPKNVHGKAEVGTISCIAPLQTPNEGATAFQGSVPLTVTLNNQDYTSETMYFTYLA